MLEPFFANVLYKRIRHTKSLCERSYTSVRVRCMSHWYMNIYFCDIYITARPRTPTAATRPGLKASRSASMGLKSSAPADSRGALWGIGCQPSEAESCSAAATHDCSTRPVPQGRSGDLRLLIAALSGWC